MTLEARITAAQTARRAAIAAKDHKGATEAMKVLSALAAEKAEVNPKARFRAADVKAFNRRNG